MEKLAEQMQITPNTLTRNIKGNPTLQTLEKIAAALGVQVSELIDEPKAGNFVCPNCGTELRLSAEAIGKE